MKHWSWSPHHPRLEAFHKFVTCRIFGHKFTVRKMFGLCCRRCYEFRFYNRGER